MAHIFFISGFMASGKSTIGRILANTLGWKFIDLDEEIEKKEIRTITKIFNDDGEDYFRLKETEILLRITDRDNLIVSLGGGTLISPENRKFILSTGKLIFLKTSPQNAYERLKYKKDRPVLLRIGGGEMDQNTEIERIESLMKLRKDSYSNADFTFSTDDESVGRTVDKIAAVIKKSIGK